MLLIPDKYKEPVLYVFFGILTTLVNWLSYIILIGTFGGAQNPAAVVSATAVAQVLAVLFAYVTNRRWVFNNKAHGAKGIAAEAARFFGCRAASFVLDIFIMFVGVSVLFINDSAVKLISNAIIIILNYALSKFFVFKK